MEKRYDFDKIIDHHQTSCLKFERFNLACPRSTIEKAMQQLKETLDHHKKWA